MNVLTIAIVISISFNAASVYAQALLQLPDNPPSDKPFIKRDLPADTVLQNRFFTMLAPKGWSVSSGGPSERFLDDITVTASSDVIGDRTHLGLHTFRALADKTLEEKFSKEKAALKPGDKLTYETWQGRKWIVKEYTCESGALKMPAPCWAAWAYDQGGRVGVLVAATPTSLVARYREPLFKMMQSVKFHPPSK